MTSVNAPCAVSYTRQVKISYESGFFVVDFAQVLDEVISMPSFDY